jgi:hypothetical protein
MKELITEGSLPDVYGVEVDEDADPDPVFRCHFNTPADAGQIASIDVIIAAHQGVASEKDFAISRRIAATSRGALHDVPYTVDVAGGDVTVEVPGLVPPDITTFLPHSSSDKDIKVVLIRNKSTGAYSVASFERIDGFFDSLDSDEEFVQELYSATLASSAPAPVRWNLDDQTPSDDANNRPFFSPDGLALHRGTGPVTPDDRQCRIRATGGMPPGRQLLWYAEITFDDLDTHEHGIGFMSAEAPLDLPDTTWDQLWGGLQSLGISNGGGISIEPYIGLNWLGDNAEYTLGLLVDYRGANPRVEILVRNDNGVEILGPVVMAEVTSALHLAASAAHPWNGLPVTLSINPGDAGVPFAFDPAAILTAAGRTADAALVSDRWGE